MGRKELLLEQFRACHNESGWFVSLQSSIKDLTNEEIIEKNSKETNSIKEIINHLLFWNELYLNRCKGIHVVKKGISNDQTFLNQDNLGWFSTIEKFSNILDGWEKEILNCEESKLETHPPHDPNGTWWEVLSHIPIHNAYHIGQIVYIRRQQGNWNSQNGVH
ncbi:hypothetical protein J6TS2_52340 [Heyndrickxia sporothermodurans]|nr:hypothetical protein J6TS2_52340 [Heyndrickxia sporothermodurans]